MRPRSIRAGAIASTALALFYIVVVAGASGSWAHLTDQARQDWYYLALIIAGFGTQVAIISELRHRHRLHHGGAAVGGAGASTVGMVACCAHHLADLTPFIGATGAAAFLTDYRVPFMILGIGVNAVGITIAARRLARAPAVTVRDTAGAETCAAA